MIRIGCLLIFVFLFKKVDSQNLIKNPSFEEYSNCPNSTGEWFSLEDWDNPTGSTPNFFHSCSSNTNSSVPYNFSAFGGYQQNCDGEGYIQLICYYAPDETFRDYLQQDLGKTLNAGTKYCGSFFVSLSNWCEYSISNLGIYFSDAAVGCGSSCLLNYSPQVLADINYQLADTLNWIQIQDTFIANGNERFLTLGNFQNNIMTNAQVFNNLSIYDDAQYYFDKLSLTLCRPPVLGGDTIHINSGESIIIGDTAQDVANYQWYPSIGLSNPSSWQTSCSATENTTYTLEKITPCDTTFATQTIIVHEEYFNVFPNPTEGAIQFSYGLLKETPGSIKIYDCIGREIYAKKLSQYSGTEVVDIGLSAGSYFVVFQSGDTRLYTKKVVVTK